MLQHATPHGGGSFALPTEFLWKVFTYTFFGALYSLAGWRRELNRPPEEQKLREDSDSRKTVSLSVKRLGQTATIGAIAGFIVAWQGQEFNQASFQAAMALAVPISDKLLNAELDRRSQRR